MQIEKIESPDFLKTLSIKELEVLASEIRSFLINNVAKTGGHLSSNLGIVELTIALHYVFNSPEDKMIYDVGHQSYVHKILTGRAKRFDTLRQFKGLSGFQKREESLHDGWEAGHSSTSLSAALGMAVARDIDHKDFHVLPIIGDGSLMNGMSMEALNQIGGLKPNMVIIFNDNNMSISENVGGLTNTLTKMRTSKSYSMLKNDIVSSARNIIAGDKLVDAMRELKESIKHSIIDSSIFGQFDIDYLGPIDGHDLESLIKALESAKAHNGPIVLHVLTQKGKGYKYAECDRCGSWHGVAPFDINTGKALKHPAPNYKAWSSIISDHLISLARENKEIMAISPAMISGSKLEKFFQEFPERSFDCGIAEEHATTFCAALAQSNKRPFLAMYSSFLQRAYDQINHDICRMDLPVVFGVDRAGLVGEDGDTHHGVFDISILSSLPNMIIAQPKDNDEAYNLLACAFEQDHSAFAIRYPRGGLVIDKPLTVSEIEIGTWTSYRPANATKVIITYGPQVDTLINLVKANNLPIEIVNARFIKPLDEAYLAELTELYSELHVYETDILKGGLGSSILEYYADNRILKPVIRYGIPDKFVGHGATNKLLESLNLDIDYIITQVLNYAS